MKLNGTSKEEEIVKEKKNFYTNQKQKTKQTKQSKHTKKENKNKKRRNIKKHVNGGVIQSPSHDNNDNNIKYLK